MIYFSCLILALILNGVNDVIKISFINIIIILFSEYLIFKHVPGDLKPSSRTCSVTMTWDTIEKSWGSITSSNQEVDPSQWSNYSSKLMQDYQRRQASTKLNILMTMVKIMNRLQCIFPLACGDNVKEVSPGVMQFDDAFKIYQEHINSEACDIKTLKKESFQSQILHQDVGLPIVIVNHKEIGKWIILRAVSYTHLTLPTKRIV